MAHMGDAGVGGELTVPPPLLTFACELDPARLADLFADSAVVDDLLALDARVALMCSDFSDERAGVVRRLNAAGVPVVGIPLLPLAEGYYFTADNADRAARCYEEWAAWTLCLPKIPSAQVGQLFGFGGGRMSWLLREGPLAAA